MRYVALLPFPSYLEQYCRFHGGTMVMPDGEEVLNLSFIASTVDRIAGCLVPFANEDAARSHGVWHDNGESYGDRSERWVRVGGQQIKTVRRADFKENPGTVWMIPKGCEKFIMSSIKDVFMFALIRGWSKAMAQAQKTDTLEEQTSYINYFLAANGISLGDTEFQAVMRKMRRFIDDVNKISSEISEI